MKGKIFAAVLGVTLLFTVTINAGGVNKNVPKANTYEAIEMNRLIGLASDNLGLRVSCAFNLGEMKSTKAVFPLMQMVREGSCEEERIIAALSLIKIGDPQGVYFVKQSAKFNDCERTRRICEKFYNGYLLQKYYEEHPEKLTELTVANKT